MNTNMDHTPSVPLGHVRDTPREPVQGPLAWHTDKAPRATEFVMELSPIELQSGVRSFSSYGVDGSEATSKNFPLPSLQGAAHIVHNGPGICVVRGIGNSSTDEEAAAKFMGVAAHIGDIHGRQNRKGDMLTHVTSSKQWKVPSDKRHGIHSNKALPFHNDMGCDILCLYVKECAEKGGDTFVAPIATIFNDLLTRESSKQTGVLEALFRPDWPVQMSGTHAPFVLAPLLEYHSGRLMANLDPARLGPHPAAKQSSTLGKVPVLTTMQKTALSALQEAAKRCEMRLSLQPGDVLFVNNWAHLHRRDAYEDQERSRHLIRLWLRNSKLGWSVPPSMSLLWNAAYKASRYADRNYDVTPQPNYKVPKYSAGSAAFALEDSDEEREEQVQKQ